MLTINPINDAESQRQKKNLTDTQKKKADTTKEGVIVKSLIKEPQDNDMNYLYNSLIISDNAKNPDKLNQNLDEKKTNFVPLSLLSIGTMASITGLSFLIKKSTENSLKINSEKKLQDMIRNVNINQEEVQALYQMIHCPNKKTVIAGCGVLVLGSMAFIGKLFIDGFKEIWVQKRDADIQKKLQENLIEIETQSFSGKIQIMRNMLSEKAKEFGKYICDGNNCCVSFKQNAGKQQDKDSPKTKDTEKIKYFALAGATVASILALGFLSLKNLSKGKVSIEKNIQSKKKEIENIIEKSGNIPNDMNKKIIKKALLSMDVKSDYAKEILSKLNWSDKKEKESFIADVVLNMEKSTTDAPSAIVGSGTPKPAFNSFVNCDYKAFLYNYLIDTDNPQFKSLFWSIAGMSALAYSGKNLAEGTKEIQVKRINAQTEFDLQRRLVSTELRNFKAKKEAAVKPLCDEFYNRAKQGKDKSELKVMAENILNEIKNGPPFVYS